MDPPSHPYSRRRIAAIVALCFVAFMIYRIGAVYTVRSGSCSPVGPELAAAQTDSKQVGSRRLLFARRSAAPAAPKLLVMTYNVEGHAALVNRRHLEELAGVLNDVKPDIVGLQEVHRGTWQSRFTDQLAELAKRTEMKGYFGKSFEALGGEFGNAILTRGKILKTTVHPLPSVGEPRTLLEATVDLDGRLFNFYVTHLATWGRLNRASRSEQVRCIEQIVRRSPYPFVLVGDFNAEETTPELAILLGSERINAAPQAEGGTHRLTRQKLDYIFPDPGWEMGMTRVIFAGDSDHWPVIAELN